MIAEVTSAALMSENKQMAFPASVDSTPTSANQEDHVSMACHGARRLLQMTDNLAGIIGIEAITAAQGVDFRAPLKTGTELLKAHAVIRAAVPDLEVDRYMAGDLAAAAELVKSGALVGAISAGLLPELLGMSTSRQSMAILRAQRTPPLTPPTRGRGTSAVSAKAFMAQAHPEFPPLVGRGKGWGCSTFHNRAPAR